VQEVMNIGWGGAGARTGPCFKLEAGFGLEGVGSAQRSKGDGEGEGRGGDSFSFSRTPA
jgi:hypothetical protein